MLTRRQQIFVAEYLRTWNTSEAARSAGYSEKTAPSQGQHLLMYRVSAVLPIYCDAENVRRVQDRTGRLASRDMVSMEDFS